MSMICIQNKSRPSLCDIWAKLRYICSVDNAQFPEREREKKQFVSLIIYGTAV